MVRISETQLKTKRLKVLRDGDHRRHEDRAANDSRGDNSELVNDAVHGRAPFFPRRNA
jgi:hypothetical protein